MMEKKIPFQITVAIELCNLIILSILSRTSYTSFANMVSCWMISAVHEN